VALNAERAEEERRGIIRGSVPSFRILCRRRTICRLRDLHLIYYDRHFGTAGLQLELAGASVLICRRAARGGETPPGQPAGRQRSGCSAAASTDL
jgi:hypothetical protein